MENGGKAGAAVVMTEGGYHDTVVKSMAILGGGWGSGR